MEIGSKWLVQRGKSERPLKSTFAWKWTVICIKVNEWTKSDPIESMFESGRSNSAKAADHEVSTSNHLEWIFWTIHSVLGSNHPNDLDDRYA